MPTLKECLALVLIALLSVLSVASPVAADHHREKAEPVNIMNKAANPVPVSVQGTVPVTIVGGAPVGTGGGGAAAPEDGAQFTRQGTTFVVFSAADLGRTGKRFVVDGLTADATSPTMNDCSLVQVRVDDGAVESRIIMKLHANGAGVWAASQAAKLYVDLGQRLLVVPFAPPCDANSMEVTVVGHYVEH